MLAEEEEPCEPCEVSVALNPGALKGLAVHGASAHRFARAGVAAAIPRGGRTKRMVGPAGASNNRDPQCPLLLSADSWEKYH